MKRPGSLLGVGVNSLGPSDLTEVKKVGRAIDHCYRSGLQKNETPFWTARGTFGLYMDPQEK